MSLSYSVYVAAPAPAFGVEQALDWPTAGEEARATQRPDRPRAHVPHPLTQTMVEESYGFRPTAVLVYRLDKHLDGDSMERPALEDIAGLLRTEQGDAYVDYAGLRTALLRRAGRITVDARWLHNRPWLQPDLQTLLGAEYTIDDIPPPE